MAIADGLLWAAIALYGAATLLYLGNLLGLPDRLAVAGRAALILGFLAHTGVITAHGIHGVHPATSVREAVGLVGWVLVAGFLVAQLRRRLDGVGAFVAPAAHMLTIIAGVAPEGSRATTMGVLGRVHISLATLGVSCFALATAIAVLYLLEERQLKHKQLGTLVKRGAALETLDSLAYRCVQVGFPIFTVAMITGALWSARLSEGIRPEYAIAMVAWTAFAGLLVARQTAGWRGRRAALTTIVGFASALTVLAIYLVRAAA